MNPFRQTFSFMAFIVTWALFSCTESTCKYPPPEEPVLKWLQVRYLDGKAYANLPSSSTSDANRIHFQLELTNTNPTDTIAGIKAINGKVFFFPKDSLLTEILLGFWETIRVTPLEVDTVDVIRVPEHSTTFPSPCGKKIYVAFDLTDSSGYIIPVRTDTMNFECIYD